VSKIPAVTIKKLAAALATIVNYTASIKPANLKKAQAMLDVINMTAASALDAEKEAQ